MVIIMNLTYGRGYVYAIEYHIVWCVKYRRKVITPSIEEYLISVLKNIAKDNDFEITEINTALDHVHLLISCSPQHYLPNMMKALKGVSARLIMKKYGDILKPQLYGGHLWNPRYFVATVSENTEDQIKTYIQKQKEK